jgi:YfiH family protein
VPGFPALSHPGWTDRFPWVVQGTTLREDGSAPFDLALFGQAAPTTEVRGNWATLVRETGAVRALHARQVHGATVRAHVASSAANETSRPPQSSETIAHFDHVPAAPSLVEPCDGHATATPGVLLAITVADCVPVFVLDRRRRAVAAVHAGWRGVAAGVLEQALLVMERSWGTAPEDITMHLGPAICGACYEVGPEVFAALDQPVPEGATPIDLREVLAVRALRAGVAGGEVSMSTHCTLCTDSGLFSHRGGDSGRQVGFVGMRLPGNGG